MRQKLVTRIIVTFAVAAVVMTATVYYLRPKTSAKSSEFRFMHCDLCGAELVYNPKLAGSRCPRCQPPKIGKLIPTTESIGAGGSNPWRRVNIFLSFEAVFLLGAIVYLLYNPPKPREPNYLYTRCPKCKRRLKYPQERAGGEGRCPACKTLFGYPLFGTEPATQLGY